MSDLPDPGGWLPRQVGTRVASPLKVTARQGNTASGTAMAAAADSDPFFTYRLDAWPVVTFAILRPYRSTAEFEALQSTYVNVLCLAAAGSAELPQTKLAVVMLLDGILTASLEQKMLAVQFIRNVRPYVESSVLCTALVVTSALVRAVLSFITGIVRLASPHRIFETEAEAAAWAAGEAAALARPPA